jgi:outer membrane protein, adhesin transport system
MKRAFLILLVGITLKADIVFEDMVSRIMKNHPNIASSNEAVKGADEAINGAKWQYFPTPSIDVSKSKYGSQTTLKLEQLIWTGGKLDAAYNQALSSKAEAIQGLEESKYKLMETVLGYAQNYIEAKYTKEALIEGLKRLEVFVEMMDRKISAGVASLSDKKLLEARITQLKTDLISSEFKENISLKQLGILLGEEINGIDFSNEFFIEDRNKEELINKVLETNPTLAKIEEQIKIAGFKINEEKASLYPTVGVSAEHIKGSIYEQDSTTNENVIYLKLQANFGAGLSVLSNIQQAKIELQKLKFEKLSYENQLIDLFWQDYNNMMVSKNKVDNYIVHKKLSSDVFESNKRLFLSDRKQWLDLVNSSKELMDVSISLVNSKVIYLISKYKVALRSGLLDLESAKYRNENVLFEVNNTNN